MSKVRVWLALENNFLALNTCPTQDCQMQLRVFFGVHWKSNKMQQCRSQGTASEKQNCWAPPQPSKSQDPEAEGGVSSEGEGRKAGSVLHCSGLLTPPSVLPCIHVCGKSLRKLLWSSGWPGLSCSIPAPPQWGQRGLELTRQPHAWTNAPLAMSLVYRFHRRFY